MSKFKSHNEQNSGQFVDKHALIFGLISVFLCGIGFSINACRPILSAALYKQFGRTSNSCYDAYLGLCSLCIFCSPRTWSFERQIWPASITLNMPVGFRYRVLGFWHRRGSMGTICWTYNRRYNRREHKHDLCIFCRHHSFAAEDQILRMGECGCRCRHRHWPNDRRITC